VALTPDQWLARLTKAMDDRSDRIRLLRSYMDGNAPLPEGADGCREAYQDFQKKARTNFGELIVEAVTERMIPAGFTMNGEPKDDDVLRKLWKANRLQIGFADVVRDMVGLSAGYMMASELAPGKALVTCEKPEQVITEQSAARPDQVRAGLKVYRDEIDGYDTAYLHIPGAVLTYYRPLRGEHGLAQAPGRVQGDWTYAGGDDTRLRFVPIFPFLNRGGLGEFEPHIDVLDRINWNILQRLVITAMQAYRQRGIELGDEDLPDEDADGKEIDYAEMFKPGPGALWRLPKGAKLWESAQADLTGILSANKDDLTHLGAVTRTPMPMLIPDGANQTAEGAAFAREGLVFKSIDRQNRADAALTLALGAALAIETGQDTPVEGIEIKWEPVERRSLQEKADASTKATDLPWRDRMTDIWGYSGDAVDAMETNRAADALNTALSNPFQVPAPGAAPAPNADDQQS
jgi:hypothetical protein